MDSFEVRSAVAAGATFAIGVATTFLWNRINKAKLAEVPFAGATKMHTALEHSPIGSIHLAFAGIHCYSGHISRQVEAYHYCSHMNPDCHQCVIYDSKEPNARLIGIEYIVSEKVFKSLPEEEKKYWHSHGYEVKSGLLVPTSTIPEKMETELMTHLAPTFGKTIHCWQFDRGDDLPYGPPQLMMALTEDSQINKALLAKRDQDLNINTKEKEKNRANIPWPSPDPAADSWKDGTYCQFAPSVHKM